MDEQITLINEVTQLDSIGNEINTYCDETNVLAKIQSVTSYEIYNSQNILTPQLKAVIWYCEYNNQRKVRYKNEEYNVYRTYITGELIELYLSREV